MGPAQNPRQARWCGELQKLCSFFSHHLPNIHPHLPNFCTVQELSAAFEDANNTSRVTTATASERLHRHWSDLTHALSGMFHASLDPMAAPDATTPTRPTPPSAAAESALGRISRSCRGAEAWGRGSAAALEEGGDGAQCPSAPAPPPRLTAWLPKEPVCAENLTPWLKLLPCRDHAGIAQLATDRGGLYSARE